MLNLSLLPTGSWSRGNGFVFPRIRQAVILGLLGCLFQQGWCSSVCCLYLLLLIPVPLAGVTQGPEMLDADTQHHPSRSVFPSGGDLLP